jgi:hypothetical protein
MLGALGTLMQTAAASTITYAGMEISTGTSYPVHDWSNAAVAKGQDSDDNNVYGSAGYWQVRPVSPPDAGAGVTVSEAAAGGNDLGITAGSYPTRYSKPPFIGSLTGFDGTFVNFDGYPVFRGPDGASLYRQGALSVPVTQGPHNSPAGDGAGNFGTPVQFTLATAGRFRLGLVVDAVANGSFAPDYVSVYSNATGTVFSTGLTRDGNPDMVFFDITGDAGETFIVGLWQNIATQHEYRIAALSLVTFDLLPDAPPVLSHRIENGNFIVSWPPETTGWTLESSTDLGFADAWDPVPGVANNSVSVPMTAPKNFFRLKKNP